VDVVAYKDIGVGGVMITVFVNGEEFVIFIVICGILEYLLFLIAARNNVVNISFKLYAGLSCHAATIS
jgi:hypothetical protein